MDAKLLQHLTEAATIGEWRRAVAIAHGLMGPAKIEDLLTTPTLALRVTRLTFHAGFALNTELLRVYGADLTGTKVTVAEFPERLSGAIFTAAVKRARCSLSSGDWSETVTIIHLVSQLPTLNSRFAEEVAVLVGHFLLRLRQAQKETMERGILYPIDAQHHQLSGFYHVPHVFGVLARSEQFPHLAERYLRALFSFADYPILRWLDPFFIVAAWQELLAISDDRPFRKQLSEAACDWLDRATGQNTGPYPLGECDDGEDE